jgi:hypothetical protein
VFFPVAEISGVIRWVGLGIRFFKKVLLTSQQGCFWGIFERVVDQRNLLVRGRCLTSCRRSAQSGWSSTPKSLRLFGGLFSLLSRGFGSRVVRGKEPESLCLWSQGTGRLVGAVCCGLHWNPGAFWHGLSEAGIKGRCVQEAGPGLVRTLPLSFFLSSPVSPNMLLCVSNLHSYAVSHASSDNLNS